MIAFNELKLGYRRGPDVVEVDHAEFCPGEVVALIGPNGGGKTTLLRSAAGLLKPRSGDILLRDRSLYGHGSWTREERARCLAIVLTDPVAPAYLRVRDLVALGRIPYRYSRATAHEHDSAVDRALEATGVQHLANRPAGQLSDGERQRVMIARALAQEPTILLLDEPATHLDPPHQTALFVMLRDLVDRGVITIAIIATHHLHMALHFAHRIVLVSRTVHASGTPNDLLARGDVSGVFADTGGLTLDPARGWFIPRTDIRSPNS